MFDVDESALWPDSDLRRRRPVNEGELTELLGAVETARNRLARALLALAAWYNRLLDGNIFTICLTRCLSVAEVAPVLLAHHAVKMPPLHPHNN